MGPKNEGFAAIDLGAGSGRVILGRFDDKRFDHEIIHRFANGVRKRDGHERWDTARLFNEIQKGLGLAADSDVTIRSLGVDSWGVDYGLLDGDGKLIEEPVFYRDERTRGQATKVEARLSTEEIYARTGIQFMDINTLNQLYAHVHDGTWPRGARTLLLMGDLFHALLTGVSRGEYTNATTTQLLNASSKVWDERIFEALGLPLDVMPDLVEAGSEIGPLKPALQEELGLTGALVVAPATHDTASAVAGTPLEKDWAYVSSGTWSLVGIECDEPILGEDALALNCSNEGGAYGTIRFLKNVMGLWILERCRKEWEEHSGAWDYEEMIEAIHARSPSRSFITPDDGRFLNPQSMVSEVHASLRESGQGKLPHRVATAKLILDSLALRYASVLEAIERAAGRRIKGIHIVGGGSQNAYLNQATANATGLNVKAGPVEATSIGNLLVQAVTAGRFTDLADARDYVGRHVTIHRYEPQEGRYWEDARAKYAVLEATQE